MIPILAVAGVVFLAGSTVVLAAGLTLRDIFGSMSDDTEPSAAWILPKRDPNQSGIDLQFEQLADESGFDIDKWSVVGIIFGAGLAVAGGGYLIYENLLIAAAGIPVGGIVAYGVLAGFGWWRTYQMRQDLNEALQMVADAIRAGRTLEQAAEMVGDELKGPLADEFKQCASHLRLGQSPVSVLERMSRRVPLPEFQVFAMAVIVHRRTGGNLSLLTERMADAARDRQEFNGHVNAVTAGSQLSAIGLIVGPLLAVGILAWIDPSYMGHFLTSDIGPLLLISAAVLQFIGALWVWRLIRVSF